VAGEYPRSKLEKAEKLGVMMISEAEFMEIIRMG
jgi:NAD-dependent DNA ligase